MFSPTMVAVFCMESPFKLERTSTPSDLDGWIRRVPLPIKDESVTQFETSSTSDLRFECLPHCRDCTSINSNSNWWSETTGIRSMPFSCLFWVLITPHDYRTQSFRIEICTRVMPRILSGMITAFFHAWIFKGIKLCINFAIQSMFFEPSVVRECCSQFNTASCIIKLS